MDKKQFSVLRQFVDRSHDWLDNKVPLDKAQEETVSFFQEQEIFEGSKDKMINTVREAPTLEKLIQYLYNSLLQWEGFGTE